MTEWTVVGRAADVPPLEGRSVRLGDVRVAVFRLADGWAALANACPHKDGPLSDGIVADACVICPLHARRFDLATGEEVGGTDAVAVFDVRERDGLLELRPALGAALDEAAVDFVHSRDHVAERRAPSAVA
jgi:nitrite reductase (NADH) small subunit